MRAVGYAFILIVASQLPAAAQFPASPAPARPPIPTRQNTFLIPFTVDDSEGLPIEVQLFVSADRGATWHLYARQRPSDGQFRFRAARDGEYWFAPKTVDQYNRVRPAGPPRPELRMLVDTVQPELRLEAGLGPSGEVRTSWEAADPQLVADSLRIEYQDAVGSRWRPVAIDAPAAEAGRGGPYAGSIQWIPETSSRVLHIRAEIQDRAGNRTVVNRRLFLPRDAATPSSPAAPPKPLAGGVPGDPFAQPATGGNQPWLGSENQRPGPTTSGRTTSSRTTSAGTTPSGTNSAERAPAGSGPAAFGSDPSRVWEPPADAEDARYQPSSPPTTASPATPPDARYKPISNSVDRSPADGSFNGGSPVTGSLAEGDGPEPPGPAEKRHYGLPPGERPRLTNSRRFSLDYDVDAVGPAGVASVELWTTTDGGRNWTRWGEDPDRTSPFDVEVESEGVYGFRVVIVGNNGLAGRAPRSGDLADIWVAVDTTQPEGRLTSAEYGQGDEAGYLVLHWEADDEWLGTRPITLLFSEHLDGPWTTIASGLPNDGRYSWQADPRMPRKIYLRMEVRDQAGNVGTFQLSDAISVEGLTPQGRIRGLRPLD